MGKLNSGFLAIFTFILILSGCNKDEKGNLSLTFMADYDGAPLVMFEDKAYHGQQSVQFSTINFFLSSVALEKDGVETPLNEIQLVDISATTPAAAAAGTVVTFRDIEADSYDRLVFGFGVPDDLNRMTPADFTTDHPLSDGAFYWQNWNSYIFSKTEGLMDTTGNGTFDLGWLVHTGSAIDSFGNLNFDAYRRFATPVNVDIRDDQTTNLTFRIDYKTMMEENGTPFDLKEKPRNHNPNDTARLKVYLNNYTAAMSIEI